MKKLEFFDPSSTVHPSSTHFPGEIHRIIYLRTKYKCILLYITLYIIYNSGSQRLQIRGDNRQGASAEKSANAPRVYVWISNIIEIWYGRKFVPV